MFQGLGPKRRKSCDGDRVYMQLSGSDSKVNTYKDTTISGKLEVGKVLNLQRHPTVSPESAALILP